MTLYARGSLIRRDLYLSIHNIYDLLEKSRSERVSSCNAIAEGDHLQSSRTR